LLGVVCIHKPEIAEQNKDGGGKKHSNGGGYLQVYEVIREGAK
jgi:hypothetical protein